MDARYHFLEDTKGKLTAIKKNIFIFLFFLSIFLSALDAFSLFSIPFPWIGYSISVLIFILYGYKDSYKNIKKFKYLFIWFVFTLFTSIIILIFFGIPNFDFRNTNEINYVLLRFVTLLFFILTLINVIALHKLFDLKLILRILIYISLLVSTLSLISYLSFIFGYQDFIRNRLGTNSLGVQKIKDACTILRNYGTFREPSFLAVWLVPTIPLFFNKYFSNSFLKYLFIIPSLSLVLTRSLTGIISILISIFFVFVLLIINREFKGILLIPVVAILIISTFGNALSFKFPALEASQCPPNSIDKCDCSIYQDKKDEAKNSKNINSSIFNRLYILYIEGISSYENIARINNFISDSPIIIFGNGLGRANIIFTNDFNNRNSLDSEMSKKDQYPGLIVSVNNLYANVYFTSGIIGLFIFFTFLKSYFLYLIKYLVFDYPEIVISVCSIFIMYFFQGEEFSYISALYLGLTISLISDKK